MRFHLTHCVRRHRRASSSIKCPGCPIKNVAVLIEVLIAEAVVT